MSQIPALVQALPAPTGYHLERRASLRHLCQTGALSRPLDVQEGISWGGTVRDISAGGLRLALCYPFRPGTYLAIDLQSPGGSRTLLARVVHVEEKGEGAYWLGCEFVKRMTESDMDVLI